MGLSPPQSQHSGSMNVPLFQPPNSPALLATPASTTSTDYFPNISRKRQRPESRDSNSLSRTWPETPAWTRCSTPSDSIYGSTYGQNSALVNERYRLAGGFDTPSLESTSRLEQLHADEYEYRGRTRDEDMGKPLHGDYLSLSAPLARERNGVARLPALADSISQQSWTNFAFGIVGKVFNFGTHVFRGFYAGGGKGYEMQKISPLPGPNSLAKSREGISTPVPGSWLQDELPSDFEQGGPSFAHQSPITRPPNKRRQTDRDTWVMVGTPDTELGPSPRRKVSSTNTPRSNLATRPQASRASSRKSIAPLPRRMPSYTGISGSPGQQYMLPPQLAPSNDRRASFASTRSPHGTPSNMISTNWMSPEAERFAKRQSKQDKAMTSMGKRMEEMIRQAQEALGTKYAVEGDLDMEDEGYVDEDW